MLYKQLKLVKIINVFLCLLNSLFSLFYYNLLSMKYTKTRNFSKQRRYLQNKKDHIQNLSFHFSIEHHTESKIKCPKQGCEMQFGKQHILHVIINSTLITLLSCQCDIFNVLFHKPVFKKLVSTMFSQIIGPLASKNEVIQILKAFCAL